MTARQIVGVSLVLIFGAMSVWAINWSFLFYKWGDLYSSLALIAIASVLFFVSVCIGLYADDNFL